MNVFQFLSALQLRGKQCRRETASAKNGGNLSIYWDESQAGIFNWLNRMFLRTTYNPTVWVIMNAALNAMQNSLRAGTSRWKCQNHWNCRPWDGCCHSQPISRLALDLTPQVEVQSVLQKQQGWLELAWSVENVLTYIWLQGHWHWLHASSYRDRGLNTQLSWMTAQTSSLVPHHHAMPHHCGVPRPNWVPHQHAAPHHCGVLRPNWVPHQHAVPHRRNQEQRQRQLGTGGSPVYIKFSHST